MRYPIGVQDFGKIIEGGFVYVDKTDLVYELAKQNVVFLSRPRRFGKLDGSAREALEQIEERQYAIPYLNDKKSVHKIGVNISSVSRTVDEWIVE